MAAPTSSYTPTLPVYNNTTLVFTSANFSTGYADADNNPFAGVKFGVIKTVGSLQWYNGTSWVNVTSNQTISKAVIDAGHLRYVPVLGSTADASYLFSVMDSTGAYDATPNRMTIDVQVPPANHVPVISSPVSFVPVYEDSGTITITSAQLLANATDADVSDTLSVVSLTTSSGTLTAVDATTWTLTPDANFNGTITLSYNVTDGHATVATTATQVIVPVNDAPIPTGIAGSGTNYTTTLDNLNNAGEPIPDGDLGTEIYNGNVAHPIEFTIFVETAPSVNATLSIPAWDIDYSSGQVDLVYINGHLLGHLEGANSVNSLTTFQVDPSWIIEGDNVVRIDVDTQGMNNWLAVVYGGTLTIDGDNAQTGGAVVVEVDEDTPSFTYTVLPESFIDLDGDALSYSATLSNGSPLPAWLLFNPSTGVFSGTPPLNYNGSVSVRVFATDGSAVASTDYTMIINPVNDLPTGAVTIDGLAASGETLTANTSAVADVDGLDVFSYQWYSNGDPILGATSATYVLTDSEIGTEITVEVSYTDGDGTDESLTSAPTDMVVTGNEAPVFDPMGTYEFDINENGADTVGTITLATDADGDDITYSLDSASAEVFGINPTTGVIYVIDDASIDYETQTSITVTVIANDGTATTEQEVVIYLNDLNDTAPVLADSSTSVNENSSNGTLVTTLAATDADTVGSLTYSATGNGTGAGLFSVAANGAITVNGALNYEAAHSYTLEVQVSDGIQSDTAMITINLNNLNDNTPTVTSPAVDSQNHIAENSTATIVTVTATDLDGSLNPLTFSLTSGFGENNLFQINPTTGALSFIAGANFEAPLDSNLDNMYDVQVAVSDGTHSSTQNLWVVVDDANDAPVIENDLLDPALEFSTTTFTLDDLSASDEDGDVLTYTLTSLPELGQLYLNDQLMEVGDTFTSDDIDNGAFKYANDGRGTTDLQGHDSFGITVGDGEDTTAGTVDINVYRDNTAPILDLNGLVLGGINGNPVEYTEEAAAVVLAPVVSFTDTDTPDLTDGHLLVEVTANSETADVLSVHNGGSNGRITISGDAVSFDGTIIGHVDSTNNGIDGAPLQINFDANPVSVIAVRHLVQSVTFESDSVGTHSDVVKTINFTVNDGEGVVAETSADATVTLTAHPVNDAPVASDTPLAVDEDATSDDIYAALIDSVTDEEGDALVIESVDTTGTVGTVTLGDGTLTYAADHASQDALAEGETATTSFTYTVSDSNMTNEDTASDTATVTVTVTGVNDAPVAVDDVNTISADATEAISGNVIDLTVAPFSAPVIDMNTSISTTLSLDEANEDRADVYGVHFVQGNTYTIDLSSNMDAFLSLYDASGTQLARNDDWAGLNSHIVYTATTTGTYYLVAKDLGDRVNMNYTLQVSDGGAVTPAVKTVEESGFVVPQANEIWSNASLQHAMTMDSDVDHNAVLSVESVLTTGTIIFEGEDPAENDSDEVNPTAYTVGSLVEGVADFYPGAQDSYSVYLTAGTYTTGLSSITDILNFDFEILDASDNIVATGSIGDFSGMSSDFVIETSGQYLFNLYQTDPGWNYSWYIVNQGDPVPAGVVETTVTTDTEIIGAYGTFTISADGSYTYTVDTENNALIALGEGESVEDTITYTLTDEHGATDTATLTVTVNGVNDAPVIVASGEGFSESNVPFAFDGLGGNPGPITVSDAEDDILTVTLTATAGTGTLDFDEVLAENTLNSFSGDVSSEVTLVGTSDAINAVLADLTFISNNGWYGTGSVTVEATDGLDDAVSQAINYEIVPTSEEYYFDANFDELVLEDGNGGVLLGQNVIYNFTLGDGVEESDYDSLTISGASAADADIVIGDLDGNPGNGDNLLINFADASVALVGVANDVNFDSGRITFQDGSFLKLNTSGEKALIIGGAAADQLIAGNMGDTLRGLGGDDKLIGGEGNDWIYGGSGNDLIEAGAGNNMINGGVGDDEMVAGEGQDWFSYSGKLGGLNSGFDAIFNFDVAMDKIQLTGFKTISPSLMDTIVFGDTVGDGSGDATLMLADNSIITLVGVNVNDLSINNFAGYSDTFTAI